MNPVSTSWSERSKPPGPNSPATSRRCDRRRRLPSSQKTLKQEALDDKDALLDKAKAKAQSSIESLIEDVKARAAANPAAALAIGAGIAWRLVRHPPIATALVGAGLISLFRTPPARPNGQAPADYLAHAKTRLREQASAAADVAQEKAAVLSETVAEKVTETAGRMKERAQDLTEQARLAATNFALDTREQATAMLSETTDALEQAGQTTRFAASTAVSRASAAMEQWLAADTGRGEQRRSA